MRLSRGPYLLVWLVLTCAQVWFVSQIPSMGGMALVSMAGLQVLKALNAMTRLHDIGRPADDAILALIPLASIGLWMQLNAPRPRDETRERTIAVWVNEPTASGLFIDGFKTLLRYPLVMFGLGVPAGIGAAVIDLYVVDALLAIPADMEDGGELLWQSLAIGTVLLCVYMLLQIGKRDRASRASWWPTLFIVPMALAATCAWMGGAKNLDLAAAFAAGNDKLFPYMLGTQALWLVYAMVVGGLLATAWAVVAADSHAPGSSESVGSRIASRFADVGAVNGAVIHAVTLGMLILVPGIIYALQYAFVPVVALMRPDARSLSTSANDSRPIRRRLFKVLFFGFLADIGIGLFVMVLAVLALGLPAGTTIGMGAGWLVRQIPAGITGLPPWLIMLLSIIATWAWGAARIGVARAWLIRNEPVTPQAVAAETVPA